MKKLTIMVEEVDNINRHRPGTGLPLPFPVLMEEDNDITVDDIERMVDRAHTLDHQAKSTQRIREDLEEMDEIVQEFTRGRDPQTYKEKGNNDGPYWPRKTIDTD